MNATPAITIVRTNTQIDPAGARVTDSIAAPTSAADGTVISQATRPPSTSITTGGHHGISRGPPTATTPAPACTKARLKGLGARRSCTDSGPPTP